jgi:hypothetical protein
MSRFSRFLPGLLTLYLAACSGPPQQSAAPAGAQDHVWKDQTGAIEKAKGVERTLLDAAAQRDRALEQESR